MFHYEQQKNHVERSRRTGRNRTGIPDPVKQQFEATSGLSLDDVRIHYRSSRPTQLGALAYTQGKDVYLGTGQERYLAHELGHVIQQKQRRIRPTATINGIEVNTSPELEREADRYAAGQAPVQGQQEIQEAGVPQLMIKDGHEVNWVNFVKKIIPEGKIFMRKVFARWSKNEDVLVLRNGVMIVLDDAFTDTRVPIWFILEAGIDKPSENIKGFYEQVTDHMKDPQYWINYATYATGDLTSLSAFILNDNSHGIAMQWQQIGNDDKVSNMNTLAEYLGGVVDREGNEYYVITEAGAKGKWGFDTGRGKVLFNTLEDDQKVDTNLKEAAVIHLKTAKAWNMRGIKIQNIIEEMRFPCVEAGRLMDVKGLWIKIQAQVWESVQNHSRAMRGAARGRNKDSAMLAVNESINAVDNNYALLLFVWLMLNKINSPLANKKIPNYVNAEFMIESLQQFNTETSGTIAGSDFNKIEDLLNASMYIWREAGMCQGAARRTLHILDALQQYLSVGKWNTDDELPENRRSNRIAGRTSFVEGTSAVAIGWDREKRERVRRAWGVGNSQAAGYDDAVETWLRMKGIDPSAIRGQQVVVLWIRKSGERGGAHFENDTSFHWLYRQIQQYNGATVILTGDDKPDGQGGSKADRLAMPDRRVYNLTQFWKDGSNELKAWGGNTRTGQFRLFDYMNRNSAGLKHVGAMSGNLEAMALLGHRTEVHAGTPEDSGVSRMMAYSVHDMGVEEEADKLHYDFAFNQQRLNTTTPYEKKAAVYYVELKRRLSSIYKSIINKNIYRIKVSPEIKFMIDENIKEVNILRDQLKQNAQIRSVAKKDIGGINLGLKLKCMKIPEVRKRRAEISEKVGRLEADERIRERISAIEPHVIDYDVSDWKNHPSLFDNSSEGMGCLWKLDVTKRKVIIDGIIRQAPFSSVWRALSAGMKPTSDFYMDMEKTYQKTNMVVWNTIWRIAGCYYYLIQHPPKNEERVDKQKEQLLDFIFIQTARIMSRSRKVQGRRNSS